MLLGIDVGGTSVKYATCDEKGHLFDKGCDFPFNQFPLESATRMFSFIFPRYSLPFPKFTMEMRAFVSGNL